jgi:Right handed beta helix region
MSTLLKCGKIGFFCCIMFTFSLCTAQQAPNFVYKAPPAALIDISAKRTPQSQMDTLIRSALDATTLLPPNYVKDGTVDYTQYLQKALNSKQRILMPDFPVLVNQNGLTIQSNSVVIFNRHSSIVMAPNGLASYNILKIHQVKNVTVYDPVIIGERKQHTGTKGEWGMGLSIRGSSNVVVYNPNVSNCWGDGIYIADIGENRAENVAVYNARLDFNRRNGMSVVSVKNLKIIDPVITNTAGTSPKSGIDIEPDDNHDIIEGIDIEHPITFNNQGSGILICLQRLVGPAQKNVAISINNFVDEQSNMGLYVYGFFDHYDNAQPLAGQINISNSTLIDNAVPFFGHSHYETGPNTQITNMSVMKRGKNGKLVGDSVSMKNIREKFSGTQKLNFN